MSNLQAIIESAFEKRADITPKTVDTETRAAIEEVIEGLDSGKYRVAEKIDGEWVTHQWLKKRYCFHSASITTKLLTVQKQNITTKWH
ncbi:2,3,4,5-tetrahydropyridine-2,6-dicarboxylate N-succinyltransferase [Rodentibacter pneumotropicus]|uniref:2,3,4,5-tetrahydropyridine-2,6-dicarboxylate N-succinyltransferase n=1 Tax=Rodentibacter pneumotropicus TaxID=758 RepID=A0A448MPD8_9PAST|nr:2,3,4,5-tetrahydropyridine-2,6-dicarboxylate N-succinyltransferase [Rodentibacter pneumotropicus]